MTQKLKFAVTKPGMRLDRYVADMCPELSRSYVQKLIGGGYVKVNSRSPKESLKLKLGDRVTVVIPPPEPLSPQPEEIPLSVVYEDNDLLVIDKPAGLTVHPAPGHSSHTLVNAVLAHCPDMVAGGSVRPGIVHRLDKNTSGLMVVAKSDAAHKNLSDQIKARSVLKRYVALVHGHLSPEMGVIEAPIGRDPQHRKRMAIVDGGREARTHYHVIKYVDDYTLLEITPETGRTHQIRLHLSAADFPVVGDEVYGRRTSLLNRQFLHAHLLGFRLPSTGEYVEFSSSLPPNLEAALDSITSSSLL